ncbi:iron permease [Amylostereum chailletii]|nr:iron permease [Amylostereum chailletii]
MGLLNPSEKEYTEQPRVDDTIDQGRLLSPPDPGILGESSPKPPSESEPPFQWSRCGRAFWMVVVANLTCDFLSAFDLTAVSTALPTIVKDLNGDDFIWAGSAYPLAATAMVPMCGGLASIFGRKPILVVSIAFFSLGSALAGAAQNVSMLIAARAIQGFGSGGALAVTEIIYADLVPLPQRGVIQGITASVWALASAVGPIVGGALATSGAWRWLFFLNLPISAIAAVLVLIYLRVNTPESTFKSKIARMDWIGNIMVVGSSASITLALTWGGLRYAWDSAQVLVSLIVGIIGLFCFFLIEKFWSKEPTIPLSVVSNRTSVSGYLGTAVHGVVSFAAIYYLPVYFQAVQKASAVRSGIDLLAMAMFITPSCMVCGVSVEIARRYRPQNYIGWMLTVVGFGILTLLNENSSKAQYIGFQVVLGIGLGIIWIATQFPILAPLPYSNNANALAFFTFVRSLSQTFGVAIGGAVLQNSLQHKLPVDFIDQLPRGVSVAYAAIPAIPSLSEPLQTEVRKAFADSLRRLFQVMIGISGLGLLTVLLMKEVDLRSEVDEQWGLQGKERSEETSLEELTTLRV